MSIKEIPLKDIRVGMYLVGIDISWLKSPFLKHRFRKPLSLIEFNYFERDIAMKNLIANHRSVIVFSILTLITILTSFIPVQSAYTDSQARVCHASHRGSRCGASRVNGNVIAQNNQILSHTEVVCSKSSRGTRCMKRQDNFVMVDYIEKQPLLNKNGCSVSSRGTRCVNKLI